MTLLHVDGFEADQDQTSTERTYGGTATYPNLFTGTITYPAGRFAGSCVRHQRVNQPEDKLQLTRFVPSQGNVTFGIAIRCNDPEQNVSFLRFHNGSSGDDSVSLGVSTYKEGSGFRVSLWRGGETIYRSPIYDYDKWLYVEGRSVLAGSGVNTWLRINGMDAYQGEVSRTPAQETWQYFTVTAMSNLNDTYVELDDLYIMNHDGDGGLFPRGGYYTSVETLFPNGPGTHSEWTPLSGTNFSQVDDGASGTVDDDASYVSGDNDLSLDLHSMSDLREMNGRIYGVEANMDGKYQDAGAVTDMLIQTGGFSPGSFSPPSATWLASYARAGDRVWTTSTNPSTGGPFTASDLRDSQIGYGNPANFDLVTEPDDGGTDVTYALDYGTAGAPTGTALDFGTASTPTGPALDMNI